ncbi:MAG: MaoC/PaaZ C-terminal domain-containing protein [Nocardioides sp.]|uniref:MaoC/PaaZ C-terminal domain-containing protein n=1 Tax=Nocardioides sp. TaxID=35761 RepID=UPI0039E56B87
MPIDLHAALAAPAQVEELAWTERDVLLYHLSLGAGRGTDPELVYTYEPGLRVLPTFALVAGQGISAGPRLTTGLRLPGLDVDLRRLLHGGQGLVLHTPLPTSATAVRTTRVIDVWDKGKAAVVVRESRVTTTDGAPLWTSTMRIWARGEGGFGGGSGPAEEGAPPDRRPDRVIEVATTPDQARLYRLNGDLNPLHIDPESAAHAGFGAPILHGLATYGIVARAVIDALGAGAPERLASYDARFAGTLLPGERLSIAVWHEEGREEGMAEETWTVEATCVDRGTPVLSHGHVRLVPRTAGFPVG